MGTELPASEVLNEWEEGPIELCTPLSVEFAMQRGAKDDWCVYEKLGVLSSILRRALMVLFRLCWSCLGSTLWFAGIIRRGWLTRPERLLCTTKSHFCGSCVGAWFRICSQNRHGRGVWAACKTHSDLVPFGASHAALASVSADEASISFVGKIEEVVALALVRAADLRLALLEIGVASFPSAYGRNLLCATEVSNR